MTGIVLLDAIYLVVGIVMLAATRAEARASGQKSFVWGMLGVVACALWPATLVVMAATVAVTARRAEQDQDKVETAVA